MIDTDKYEGYYKGWVNDYGDVVKLVYPNREAPSLDADQRLISDAPLILQALIDEREEVERLREQLIQAESWVWVEGGHIFETSEDRLKHYKEYIGDD